MRQDQIIAAFVRGACWQLEPGRSPTWLLPAIVAAAWLFGEPSVMGPAAVNVTPPGAARLALHTGPLGHVSPCQDRGRIRRGAPSSRAFFVVHFALCLGPRVAARPSLTALVQFGGEKQKIGRQ